MENLTRLFRLVYAPTGQIHPTTDVAKFHLFIDDFLLVTRRKERMRKGRRLLGHILKRMGLQRKIEKGCWGGRRMIEHLGLVVDTKMVFGVTSKCMEMIRGIARSLLYQARCNRRLVYQSLLRYFCGVDIYSYLAMPLARFYTR